MSKLVKPLDYKKYGKNLCSYGYSAHFYAISSLKIKQPGKYFYIADASDKMYAGMSKVEEDGSQQRSRIGAQNYFSGTQPNKIADYHSSGSNAIFVDGHVAHASYSEYTLNKDPWKVQ